MRMKQVLLMLALVLSLVGIAGAEQKYNSFTGSWETAADSDFIKFNAMDGSWSYQSPDAQIVFNPFQGTWDWRNPGCKKPSQGQIRKGDDARFSTTP